MSRDLVHQWHLLLFTNVIGNASLKLGCRVLWNEFSVSLMLCLRLFMFAHSVELNI